MGVNFATKIPRNANLSKLNFRVCIRVLGNNWNEIKSRGTSQSCFGTFDRAIPDRGTSAQMSAVKNPNLIRDFQLNLILQLKLNLCGTSSLII